MTLSLRLLKGVLTSYRPDFIQTLKLRYRNLSKFTVVKANFKKFAFVFLAAFLNSCLHLQLSSKNHNWNLPLKRTLNLMQHSRNQKKTPGKMILVLNYQ